MRKKVSFGFRVRRLNRIKKKKTKSHRYLRKKSFEGRGLSKKKNFKRGAKGIE